MYWPIPPSSCVLAYSYLKGFVHQFFYRSTLIFLIVMGCGIADFGRRGLKRPKTQKNWPKILSPGVSTSSAWGFDSQGTDKAPVQTGSGVW